MCLLAVSSLGSLRRWLLVRDHVFACRLPVQDARATRRLGGSRCPSRADEATPYDSQAECTAKGCREMFRRLSQTASGRTRLVPRECRRGCDRDRAPVRSEIRLDALGPVFMVVVRGVFAFPESFADCLVVDRLQAAVETLIDPREPPCRESRVQTRGPRCSRPDRDRRADTRGSLRHSSP